MLPTLRQLQYLRLLAEHGSFSRAAEAAHVTQPTLSAGIQELERALEAPVVDRARSGVILTARSKPDAAMLGKAMMGRRFRKTYLAVLAAAPEELRQEVLTRKSFPRRRLCFSQVRKFIGLWDPD